MECFECNITEENGSTQDQTKSLATNDINNSPWTSWYAVCPYFPSISPLQLPPPEKGCTGTSQLSPLVELGGFDDMLYSMLCPLLCLPRTVNKLAIGALRLSPLTHPWKRWLHWRHTIKNDEATGNGAGKEISYKIDRQNQSKSFSCI